MRIKITILFIFLSFLLPMNTMRKTYGEVKKIIFSYFSPVVDGFCDPNYWNDSLVLSYDFGNLYFKNNRENLFILIDFVKDTLNDNTSIMPRNEDYFEIIFDWDGNKKITPGIDRLYTLSRKESNRLIYRYLIGKAVFSSIYYSSGKAIPGFGATMIDKIPHRFYECMIPLTEAKIDNQNYLSFGIKVVSKNPSLIFEEPNNLYQDFLSFQSIEIAKVDKKIKLDFSIGTRIMYVNLMPITMDVDPFLYHRRAYIPCRYVIEPFGGYFEWSEKDNHLVILLKEKMIEFRINDPYAYINGKKIPIDKLSHQIVPLLIPPGRVFIPMRFLSESIGCTVLWNSKEQSISLIYESS